MNTEQIEDAMQDVFGKKKHHYKIFIVLVIAVAAIFVFYSQLFSPSGQFKQEDVVFVSRSDLDFQSKVKNVTGYDWSNFLNADGSNNAKLAALLLLANEIDALNDNFAYVKRSVGLRKAELGITRLNATDTSKNNLLKLIRTVKSVENVFSAKGLESAKIMANRLSVIENFFGRHSLPEGEIKMDVKDIFAEKLGLTVDDYSRLVSLTIVNYNLFLAE